MIPAHTCTVCDGRPGQRSVATAPASQLRRRETGA